MVWFVNLLKIPIQLSYVCTANPKRPSTGKPLGSILATLHCKSVSGITPTLSAPCLSLWHTLYQLPFHLHISRLIRSVPVNYVQNTWYKTVADRTQWLMLLVKSYRRKETIRLSSWEKNATSSSDHKCVAPVQSSSDSAVPKPNTHSAQTNQVSGWQLRACPGPHPECCSAG
jgi:hypothetical protein